MKAKCSHCNNGWVSPYDRYGHQIHSGVCDWCDGLAWIPFDRFQRQIKDGRADVKMPEGMVEMTDEERAEFKSWVDGLGKKKDPEMEIQDDR